VFWSSHQHNKRSQTKSICTAAPVGCGLAPCPYFEGEAWGTVQQDFSFVYEGCDAVAQFGPFTAGHTPPVNFPGRHRHLLTL
jgi:hypothetical protein